MKDLFFSRCRQSVLFFSFVFSLFILGSVLALCRFGYEFTDEAFYLMWITMPDCSTVSVTAFGSVYHVFYRLFGESIVALRIINVLSVFCMAWIFCAVALRQLFKDSLERLDLLALAGSLAAVSLSLFTKWSPTPGYNCLALIGIMVASTGVLLVDRDFLRKCTVGWMLLGVGGWLVFMGKPTTALALGCFVFVFLLISGRLSLGGLLLAGSCSVILLVISALLMDGSLVTFYSRFAGGRAIVAVSSAGYKWSDVFRIDPMIDFKPVGFRLLKVFVGALSVVYATVLSGRKRVSQMGVILSVGLCVCAVLAMFGGLFKLAPARDFKWYLIWSVPLSAALGSLLYFRHWSEPFGRFRAGLLFLCAMLPYALALGTNTNMWQFSFFLSISWVMIGVIFLSLFSPPRMVVTAVAVLALSAQLVLVLFLWPEFETPFRQDQPLSTCTQLVSVGQDASPLTVSDSAAECIRQAQRVAEQAGFVRGTPVLDLAQNAHGVVFALGAFPVGGPQLGGARGEAGVASLVIRRISAKVLAESWLVVESVATEKSSALEILSMFGADLESDYKMVGYIQTISGGDEYQLFKPIRSVDVAMRKCVEVRNGSMCSDAIQ